MQQSICYHIKTQSFTRAVLNDDINSSLLFYSREMCEQNVFLF